MAKLLSGTRIYGNLTVDTWANAASANISGTTTSTSTTTGALVVAGGVGISGNINVGGTYANLSTGGSTGSFISIQGGTPSGGISTVKLNAIDWSGVQGNSVNLWYGAQQGGAHSFRTGAGQLEMVRISQTSSAVNYLNLTGAVTGSGPTLSAQGTDLNIDLVLNATGIGNISTINPVRITNANTSVSATTGALQVSGGVGIAGNLYVGGNLTISGSTTTINNTTIETTEFVQTIDATTVRAVTMGNIGANMVGTGTYLTSLNASNLSSGTVPSAQISGSYTGITALNTVTGASFQGVIGNVTPATGYFTTVTATTVNAATIGNSGATLTGTLSTAAQTNITSVGTLTGLTSSGAVSITNSTASTSTGTGALIVSGGAGVAGNTFIGGNLVVSAGTQFIRSPSVAQANLKVTSDSTGFQITAAVGESSLGSLALAFGGQADIASYMVLAANGGRNYIDTRNRDFYIQDYLGAQPFYISQASGNALINSTTTSTSTNTGALTVKGGAGISGNLYVGGNVNIGGNLTVTGNSVSIGASTLSINDPIINLNTPSDLTPLTTATTADIGLKFHYYDTADSAAFLGRAVDTGYLEWYSRGTDTANVFTGTVYGTIKSGGLTLANSTTSTSTTSGALIVSGGAGIAGNINVGGFANIAYTPASATGAAVQTYGSGTQGGTTYLDFLKATNTAVGATNPSKSFRLDSSGTLQIINSAYTTNLLNLTDGGDFTVPGKVTTNALYTTTGLFWAGNGYAISTGGSGSASGSTGQIQYNNGGTFGASGLYYYSANSVILATGGTSSTSTTAGQLQVLGGAGFTGNVVADQVHALNNGNGTNFRVGDDVWLGDINVANTMGMKGLQDATQAYIVFGNSNNTNYIGRSGTNPITVTGAFAVTGATQTAAITSSGTIIAATVNAATIGNSGATLTGTLSTAAQTNITSVGTLTGLTVTGNTDIQNTVYGRGVYDNSNRVVSTSSGAGNLTISGTGINLTPVGPGATTTGSSTAIPVITTDAYGRIASITTSSVSTTISLAGTSGTGSVSGGGTLTFAGSNGMTATASSSTITISTPQDLQTTASPTFANLTVANIIINTGGKRNNRNIVTNYTGNTAPATPVMGDEWFRANTGVLYKYTFDNITNTNNWVDISSALYNASTSATASTLALRDSSGNLTANWFLGRSTSASYADLAEMYTADDEYGPATVVVFGGSAEITVTTESHDHRVAGVISTNPAYLMNSELAGGLPVAFTGRVPCLVRGPVTKGDLLVTSTTPGVAQRLDNRLFKPGCVIGKSLDSIQNDDIATIEVAVGRY